MLDGRIIMSTKIFNGYRRKVENIDDLQNFLNVFKEKARRLHQKAYMKAYVDYVVRIIDSRAAEIEGEESDNAPFWIVQRNIQKDYEKTKLPGAARTMEHDFECSVSIFLEGEYAYFMVFSENKKFKALFSRQKGVHEFHYWNNTDKPRHISNKRWEERSEIWDRILGPSGVPADRSMTMEVVGTYAGGLLRPDEIIKNIPSFEDRVLRMAGRTIFKHLKCDDKTKYSDIITFVGSKEYNELLKLEQVELAKKLKHTIEKDDII